MNNKSPNVQYMSDVRYMPDVKYMPDVTYMPDVQYMPDVSYRMTNPFRSQEIANTNLVSKKSDDTSKANSLVDIIWPFSKDSRQEVLDQVPILRKYNEIDDSITTPINAITGLETILAIIGDLYLNVGEPFTKINDNFTLIDAGKEILFNSLNELGEDADILSNIVKSQVPSAGGEAWDVGTLAQSVGFDSNRKKFNYNTGNTVYDIILETISDPLFYVTIALSIGSAAGKAGISSTVKTTLAESADDLSEEAVAELSKVVVKELAKTNTDDIAEEVMKQLSRKTSEEIVKAATEAAVKEAVKEAAEKAVLTSSYRIFKATTTALDTIKTIEKGWNIASQWMTPLGPIKLVTPGIKSIIKTLYSKIIKDLENVEIARAFVKHGGEYTEIAGSTVAVNNAINQTIFEDNADRFFKPLRTNATEAQVDILNMLKTKNAFDETFDLAQEYITWLQTNHAKEFNAAIVSKEFQKFIKSKDFVTLVEALSAAPIAIQSAEINNTAKYSTAVLNSLKKYLGSKQKSLEDTYNYVDKILLTYNGTNYGLENIENFLKVLLTDKNIDKAVLYDLVTTLESLGITIDSAKAIDKILKSTAKDKNKLIIKALENSKGVKLLESENFTKMINKATNQIRDDIASELNSVIRDQIATKNKELYEDIINSEFVTIDDAVKAIKNDQNVEHATLYIQYVLRTQTELPEQQEVMTLLNKAIQENSELAQLKQYVPELEKFFKDTNRIISTLDTNVGNSFDIPNWYNSLDNILKTLKQIDKTLIKQDDPKSVKAIVSITSLIKALNAFKTEKFVDNITLYMEDIDNMVITQLSHYGMFGILEQYTFLSDDPKARFVVEQLADKNSIYRKELVPKIIKHFEDIDMPATAMNIKKVIAQIDTVTNLINVKNTELVLPFKLNNKTQNMIKNIIYDEIDNHKHRLVSDILIDDTRSYDELLSKSHKDFENNIKKSYREIIEEKMDYHIDNTPELTKLLAEQVPNEDIAIVKGAIKEQMHEVLSDYIKAQELIQKEIGIDNISLSSIFSTATTDVIKLIGDASVRFNLANGANFNKEILSAYDILVQDLNTLGEQIDLGVDEIARIDKELRIPIAAQDATELLKQVSEQHNLYSASIESNMYTTKYIIDKTFTKKNRGANIYNLTQNNIIGTNDEYALLTNYLKSYENILHEDFKYSRGYIDGLKNALIATYSRPNALYRPVDPTLYFNSLEPQALLGWEVFSKSAGGLNNRTAFEINARKLIQQQMYINKYTKADLLAELNDICRNAPFVDADALSSLVASARSVDALEYANKVVDANFLTTLHSMDDLGRYKDDLVTFLESDVAIQDDIVSKTIEIENSIAIRENLEGFSNRYIFEDFTNSTIGYEEGLRKPLIRAYQERKTGLAISIASMDAEELATHIYRQTPGALAFYNSNIILTRHLDGSVDFQPIANPFNFTEKELKDAGLAMKKITDEKGVDLYLFRLTDNREHTKIPTYKALATGHRHVQEGVTDIIDKYRDRLNLYEVEDVPANLITVETLNKDTWNTFMKAFEDFFGNIEEQKLYQKVNKRGVSTFFDKSFERINLSIIGGYDVYNVWNSTYSHNFIPRSIELTRNTLNGLTNQVIRSNRVNKYLSMFFNKDWSLSESPLLKKMFADADDKQVEDFFESGKYKVALLRKDKQGLPKVYEFYVHNRATLDEAAAAGGILVPRETYSALRHVVNRREMTNELLDVYRRVVPSTYKSMYLWTSGFLFRNSLDTLLYKNMNELGGLTSLPKILKYEYEASKAIELHNQIQKEALAIGGEKTFGKKELLKALKNHTQQEIEVYFLTDIFTTSTASGGLSRSLADFIEDYNKANSDDIRWLWEKVYEDKILFGKQPWNPLSWTREINNHIEQTGRFALFLASVDEGLPVNDAIARVVKTHFDYNSQHDLLDICERIFWFSTFPINNFNYYISGGLERSPDLYKFLLDTQTASWNNGEYTYEELKKTKFLSYHALVGNLRIGNYIIKTNPSVFDFLGLVMQPISNIKERVNPFIATATGLIEKEDIAEELNPLQTQLRNAAKIYQAYKGEPDGSWIPSIYSKINDYKYIRSAGKWRYAKQNYTTSYNSYPKIRKPHAYISYVRKYYAKRYSTNVRKVMRSALRVRKNDSNYYRVYKKGPTYFESIWT